MSRRERVFNDQISGGHLLNSSDLRLEVGIVLLLKCASKMFLRLLFEKFNFFRISLLLGNVLAMLSEGRGTLLCLF